MKRRVMILGASRYYLRSIQAAREMGHEVVVLDRNPEAPGLKEATIPVVTDIMNVPAVVEAARRFQVDGVVPLNDLGAALP